MSDVTQSFIRHLTAVAERDRASMAVLRRSLSFDPGTYPAAFPLVEGFISERTSRAWRRSLYLVAGLFASNGRNERGVSFAAAFARLHVRRKSASLEQRFIGILDADEDQLPFRLRQAVSLLTADAIGFDYERLANDLPWWNAEDRQVQQRWARDFYRVLQSSTEHDDSQ